MEKEREITIDKKFCLAMELSKCRLHLIQMLKVDSEDLDRKRRSQKAEVFIRKSNIPINLLLIEPNFDFYVKAKEHQCQELLGGQA